MAASLNAKRRILCLGAASLTLTLGPLQALTLSELLRDPKLTPKSFADRFEDFGFEYGSAVQPPDAFLQTRRGDCDDYAILADYVLHQRGFETRLVHVRVAGKSAHAVCYIRQNHAYLDYNNRKYFVTLARSGPTLREIADKVAESLEANWISASEFTYDYQHDRKQFGATVVRTDPPERDPDYRGRAEPDSRS